MGVTNLYGLFLSCVMMARVIGRFGGQPLNTDMEFGTDVMVATVHKPSHAPDDFRDTTNLHIFSRHMVAIKNDKDRECYIRHFQETEKDFRERIENAKFNHGLIDGVMQERFSLEGTEPLSSRTVRHLLGSKIVTFCGDYPVFAIGEEDSIQPNPTDENEKRRSKRSVSFERMTASMCRNHYATVANKHRWHSFQ